MFCFICFFTHTTNQANTHIIVDRTMWFWNLPLFEVTQYKPMKPGPTLCLVELRSDWPLSLSKHGFKKSLRILFCLAIPSNLIQQAWTIWFFSWNMVWVLIAIQGFLVLFPSEKMSHRHYKIKRWFYYSLQVHTLSFTNKNL